MDWSAQTNEMMKTWGEAQKQLWSGWMDLAQGAQHGSGRADVRSDADFPHGSRCLVRAQGGPVAAPCGQHPRHAGRHDAQHEHADAGVADGGAEAGGRASRGSPTCRSCWSSGARKCRRLPKRAASASGDFAQLSKSLFERWTPITAPWLSMLSQATAGGHPGEAFMSGTSGIGQLVGLPGDVPGSARPDESRRTAARNRCPRKDGQDAEGRRRVERPAGRAVSTTRRRCPQGWRSRSRRPSSTRQARREGREADQPT